MPQPKKGARLGGSAAHQKLMVANLATQLFEHGRIVTTEARARFLRPVAEKLITKAKKAELGTVESLHNRRQVLRIVRDKSVVHELFTEIGPRFKERPGGYTRITKLGPRKGDNAPMAVIELVTDDYKPKPSTARKPAEKADVKPADEAPVEETVEDVVDETPAEDVAEETVVDDATTEESAEVAEETPAAEEDTAEAVEAEEKPAN